MDAAEFGARLHAAAADLTGPAMHAVMDTLGVDAARDAAVAVRADLGGDLRFSGWERLGDLAMTHTHIEAGVIELGPSPAVTAGGWKVAEAGRNVGRSRPISSSTGEPRRGGRRWNGRTAPMHTVADFIAVTARETPLRAAAAIDALLEEAING